jgi:hypothetical protein
MARCKGQIDRSKSGENISKYKISQSTVKERFSSFILAASGKE